MAADIQEIWKDIPGYEGLYQVSNLGRVKSFQKDKNGALKFCSKNNYGYLTVCLTKDTKDTIYYVHRLVALLFIPNPYMCKEINHKDGNKENNCVDNLEWCTRSENIKHAFAKGLKVNKKGSASSHAKTFYQFDQKGNLIAKWGSLVECADFLASLNPKNGPAHDIRIRLTATLHNRHKSCCGYLFSFEPEINYKDKMKNMGQKAIKGVSVKDDSDVIYFDSFADTHGYITKEGKVLDKTNVCKCVKGKRESHGGYKWFYID